MTLVGSAALLAGCQNSSSDAALLEKAQRTALLPDCYPLRVEMAHQERVQSGGVRVVVSFAGTSRCMDTWMQRLDQAGWSASGNHGGLSSPDRSTAAGRSGGDGYIIWHQQNFEPHMAVSTGLYQ